MFDTFYDVLAARYDTLQSDMDCGRWADFLEEIINDLCTTCSGTKSIIDLGCGTGSVDVLLSSKGFDVTGVDNAEAMLEIASGKDEEGKITWLLHDITDFEPDGKTDCFLSLLDTMDHIMDKEKITGIFRSVSDHLLPGGVFIFDVITEKHLARTLGENVFYQDYEDFLLLWINHYDSREKVNTAELTFFEVDEEGKYDRYDGDLVERFYPEDDLIIMASSMGLVHKATYGELKRAAPSEDEERIFLVFAKE